MLEVEKRVVCNSWFTGNMYFVKGTEIRHREDGPAIEFSDGDSLWYFNNKLIKCSSQEEFERLMKLKFLW